MPESHEGGDRPVSAPPPVEVFLALGNKTRLEVLKHLAEGPKDVTTLAACVRRGPSGVSQALAKLAEIGIVDMERDKLRHIYRISQRVRLEKREGFIHFELHTAHGGRIAVDTKCLAEPPSIHVSPDLKKRSAADRSRS